MANPVFNSANFKNQMRPDSRQVQDMSVDELSQMYQAPAATHVDTNRVTYGDVINKSIITLGLVIAGAVIGWMFANPVQNAVLYFGAAIVGFVLGLVNAFKRKPSPGLIMAYSIAQGVFLGGLSVLLDTMYPGVAMQALLATLSVFAVVLALYKSGKVRATPRMTRMFMIAMIGYALFSLVNFGLMIFGVTNEMFGLRSGWLGIAIGLIAILLATYALVMDFTMITEGVNQGAPKLFAWAAAFGLTVTLIWLYVELLRLLSIIRNN